MGRRRGGGCRDWIMACINDRMMVRRHTALSVGPGVLRVEIPLED